MEKPIVTRIKGGSDDPRVVETVLLDYGPKLGVTTVRLIPSKRRINLDRIDDILRPMGLCLDRDALPPELASA